MPIPPARPGRTACAACSRMRGARFVPVSRNPHVALRRPDARAPVRTASPSAARTSRRRRRRARRRSRRDGAVRARACIERLSPRRVVPRRARPVGPLRRRGRLDRAVPARVAEAAPASRRRADPRAGDRALPPVRAPQRRAPTTRRLPAAARRGPAGERDPRLRRDEAARDARRPAGHELLLGAGAAIAARRAHRRASWPRAPTSSSAGAARLGADRPGGGEPVPATPPGSTGARHRRDARFENEPRFAAPHAPGRAPHQPRTGRST